MFMNYTICYGIGSILLLTVKWGEFGGILQFTFVFWYEPLNESRGRNFKAGANVCTGANAFAPGQIRYPRGKIEGASFRPAKVGIWLVSAALG